MNTVPQRPVQKASPLASRTAPAPAARRPEPVAAAVARPPAPPRVVTNEDQMVATLLATDVYTKWRNAFMIRVTSTSLILNIVLGTALALVCLSRTPDRILIEDQAGHVTNAIAVSEPITAVGTVMNWTANAVLLSYNFGFANYQRALSIAEQNFTPGGRLGFEKALTDSGVLESVKQYRYDVTAVITRAPQLLKREMIDGRFAYVIEVPLAVTYQASGGPMPSQNMTATVTVVRVPMSENISGLGIQSLVLK